MDLKTVCRRYASLMAMYGDEEQGHNERTFTLNELVFTFEKIEDDWVPTGLGYQLFGMNSVLLEEEGKIYISELNEDPITGLVEEQYELIDEALLLKSRQFLVWRLGVLKELHV